MSTEPSTTPSTTTTAGAGGEEKKRIAFIPLESNPQVFNQMAWNLGLSKSISFTDVFDLTALDFFPRPAYALVLTFPVSKEYNASTALADKDTTDYDKSGESEPVIWFKQTIRNACGAMGMLHAMLNGSPDRIDPNTPLSNILSTSINKNRLERIELLETSEDLKVAHKSAGESGQTAAPEPEDEVEHHFIAFVVSKKDNHLYQLDGSRKGPIDLGEVDKDADAFCPRAVEVVQKMMTEGGGNIQFSLMALINGKMEWD